MYILICSSSVCAVYPMPQGRGLEVPGQVCISVTYMYTLIEEGGHLSDKKGGSREKIS